MSIFGRKTRRNVEPRPEPRPDVVLLAEKHFGVPHASSNAMAAMVNEVEYVGREVQRRIDLCAEYRVTQIANLPDCHQVHLNPIVVVVPDGQTLLSKVLAYAAEHGDAKALHLSERLANRLGYITRVGRVVRIEVLDSSDPAATAAVAADGMSLGWRETAA